MAEDKSVIIENPEVLKPKKYEFQHAASGGRALEPEIVCQCGQTCRNARCPECGEATKPQLNPVLDGHNQPVIRDGKPVMRVLIKHVAYGRGAKAGDVFASNVELDKLHNRKGFPPKFVRLDAAHDPNAYAVLEERGRADKLAVDRRKLLERMTREQLQDYAENELGIDLKGKTKREAILAEILKIDLVPATA